VIARRAALDRNAERGADHYDGGIQGRRALKLLRAWPVVALMVTGEISPRARPQYRNSDWLAGHSDARCCEPLAQVFAGTIYSVRYIASEARSPCEERLSGCVPVAMACGRILIASRRGGWRSIRTGEACPLSLLNS